MPLLWSALRIVKVSHTASIGPFRREISVGMPWDPSSSANPVSTLAKNTSRSIASSMVAFGEHRQESLDNAVAGKWLLHGSIVNTFRPQEETDT